MKKIVEAFSDIKKLMQENINISYSTNLIKLSGNLININFNDYVYMLKNFQNFFMNSITLIMKKGSDSLDLGYGFNNIDILDNDIREYLKNNYINIEIIIDKKRLQKVLTCNGIINSNIAVEVFYSKSEILNYFTGEYCEIENKLSDNKLNCFIIIDNNILLINKSICIIGGEEINNINLNYDDEYYSNRNNIIKLRNELCNWNRATRWIIPNDFYFEIIDDEVELQSDIVNLFMKLCLDLVIRFIANSSVEIEGRTLSTISGNKKIDVEFNADFKHYNIKSYKELYKLYNWIYEKYSFDKINICRNVISVLISAKWNKDCPSNVYNIILNNSTWLKDSVEDNFKKFLNGNVNEYFKEKSNIITQIGNDISIINNQIYEITKIVNSNLISFIGIIIAGVVGYVAKGEISLIKILMLLYVGQLDINIILNIPLILIRFFQSKSDFNYKCKQYENTYLEDKQLDIAKKKNKVNTTTFYIYVIIVIIIVVIINFILYKLIKDSEFVNNIMKWINIKSI